MEKNRAISDLMLQLMLNLYPKWEGVKKIPENMYLMNLFRGQFEFRHT